MRVPFRLVIFCFIYLDCIISCALYWLDVIYFDLICNFIVIGLGSLQSHSVCITVQEEREMTILHLA